MMHFGAWFIVCVHTSVVRSINVCTSSENKGGSKHCACGKAVKLGVMSLNGASHRTNFADSNNQQQHTKAASCSGVVPILISYHLNCAAFAKSGSNTRVCIEHSGMERGAQDTGVLSNAGTAAHRRAKREKRN